MHAPLPQLLHAVTLPTALHSVHGDMAASGQRRQLSQSVALAASAHRDKRALREGGGGHLEDEEAELRHLTHRDEGLEEWQLQAARGRQVVAVHEDVNRGVEERREPALATRAVVHDGPPDWEERRRVVVHVQERDLPVVLLEDHDEGVHKLVRLRARHACISIDQIVVSSNKTL